MITFLENTKSGKYHSNIWFFFDKNGLFQGKKGIRIFELFTLTIHYIRILAYSYSLTNTNYFCPNYSNNQIFEYRTKNPTPSSHPRHLPPKINGQEDFCSMTTVSHTYKKIKSNPANIFVHRTYFIYAWVGRRSSCVCHNHVGIVMVGNISTL